MTDYTFKCRVCNTQSNEIYRVKERDTYSPNAFIQLSKDLHLFACPNCNTVLYFDWVE